MTTINTSVLIESEGLVTVSSHKKTVYDLEWRKKGSETLTGSVNDVFDSFYDVSDLDSNTTYEWRVRAKIGGEIYPWSEWEEFTTISDKIEYEGFYLEATGHVSFTGYSLKFGKPVVIKSASSVSISGYKKVASDFVSELLSRISTTGHKDGKRDFVLNAHGSFVSESYKLVSSASSIISIGEVVIEVEDIIYPEVITDDATNVTTESAKLHGEILQIGQKTTYVDVYFQYRRYGDEEWISTTSQRFTEPSSFEYNLTELDPNREYEYRAAIAW